MSAPEVIPTPDELAAILHKMRPDTAADDWRGAMLAAQTVGWTWKRTFAEIGRIVQHDGHPYNLRDAVSHLPKPRSAR